MKKYIPFLLIAPFVSMVGVLLSYVAVTCPITFIIPMFAGMFVYGTFLWATQ